MNTKKKDLPAIMQQQKNGTLKGAILNDNTNESIKITF